MIYILLPQNMSSVLKLTQASEQQHEKYKQANKQIDASSVFF